MRRGPPAPSVALAPAFPFPFAFALPFAFPFPFAFALPFAPALAPAFAGRPAYGWQRSQKYVLRPPCTTRRIAFPHSGQGSPSRP